MSERNELYDTPCSVQSIDMDRLLKSLPRDVSNKLSLHDIRRIVENYEAGKKLWSDENPYIKSSE